MIKIIHIDFDTEFTFDRRANSLCFESPTHFAKAVYDLKKSMEEDGERFRFSEGATMLKPSKIAVALTDYYSLDGWLKKINSLLSKRLLSEILNEQYEITKIYGQLYNLIDNVAQEYDAPIMLNEDCDYSTLIKLLNPMVNVESETLLERLVDFINLCVEFLKIKVLILVDVKHYLEENELLSLAKHCALKEVGLFMLGSSCPYCIDGERAVVIDKDYCEILVKE
ncbi:MAG: type II-A CRISPR-associated protein Csn2 [Clostridia bacterium]|nr:type II-A CRISPR-associated protein Csn2 [Clostridia bacterium]